MDRRRILQGMAGLPALLPLFKVFAASSVNEIPGNFRYIYGDANLRSEFYDFLVNVFHLFPEQAFHELIESVSVLKTSDNAIYQHVQSRLDLISPTFASLRYALPALTKQKDLIAAQTSELLGDKRQFNGYLELGTTGRYLDTLEEQLQIEGDRFFIAEKPATYSPVDMIDRGQMLKAGQDILLNDYQPVMSGIARQSLELVTLYIGFHHCPIPLRQEFITGIRDVMRDGGYLVVRDHNVVDAKMQHMVGLAHDVFNLGTMESWQYNQAERRHFYSLAQLDSLLQACGFRSDGRKLYQAGDPTHNALMLYRKV